jgi:hypothetical protein
MSYQLPNGEWVSARGDYGQSLGGAWGGPSSGGNAFIRPTERLQPTNFFYSGASSGGSSGLLSNGRQYEPYFGPATPLPPIFNPGCDQKPFEPRFHRRDGC